MSEVGLRCLHWALEEIMIHGRCAGIVTWNVLWFGLLGTFFVPVPTPQLELIWIHVAFSDFQPLLHTEVIDSYRIWNYSTQESEASPIKH